MQLTGMRPCIRANTLSHVVVGFAYRKVMGSVSRPGLVGDDLAVGGVLEADAQQIFASSPAHQFGEDQHPIDTPLVEHQGGQQTARPGYSTPEEEGTMASVLFDLRPPVKIFAAMLVGVVSWACGPLAVVGCVFRMQREDTAEGD